MNTDVESKVLKFFEGKEDQFPMICQCLKEATVSDTEEKEDNRTLRPGIWVIRRDDEFVSVVCVNEEDPTLIKMVIPSFLYAHVEDKEGKVIDCQAFVNFGLTRTFAKLEVPRSIYKECYFYIEKCYCQFPIGGRKSEKVSLSQFDEVDEDAMWEKLPKEVGGDQEIIREKLPEKWRTDYDNAVKAGILYKGL